MIQKGQIYAEEFRSQLNERLPLAMRAMEEATGKTAKELSKMMEEGKLGIDVLPKFGKALRRLANEGGALDKSLKSVRVTENRMITQIQKSSDVVFKSGFGEGLAELYMTIEKIFKDSGPALQKFGATMGRVFKGIAHVLRVLEPYMKLFISNLEFIAGGYLLHGVYKLSKGFTFLGVAIKGAFLPITAALFALEEIASLMSDKLVGGIEKKMGKQFNFMDMTTSDIYTDKEGKLRSRKPQEMSLFNGVSLLEEASRKFNPLLNTYDTLTGLFSSSDNISRGIPAAQVTQYITIDAPSEDVAWNTYKQVTTGAIGR